MSITHPNVRKNITVSSRHNIDIAKPIYVTIDSARASSGDISYNHDMYM